MEALLQRTVPVTPIPVMVDVDDGYGNVPCVVQTVRRLEASGAAGIMMEDQRSPLGTPTAGGVAVISTEAAIGKFKAAADARKDRDFFIIGRTESFWPEGLDSAIDRANAYVEAGADAVFLTGALSVAGMATVGRQVKAPHNMAMPSGYIPRPYTGASAEDGIRLHFGRFDRAGCGVRDAQIPGGRACRRQKASRNSA
jgi:2-methylisocitrate lyase-like PEP mutase family enzyme